MTPHKPMALLWLVTLLCCAPACQPDSDEEQCQITRRAPGGPVVRVEGHCAGRDFEGEDLTDADLLGVTWEDSTCPDGTNSDDNGDTCEGHLEPDQDPDEERPLSCQSSRDCGLAGLICVEGFCQFDCSGVTCPTQEPICQGDAVLQTLGPGFCNPQTGRCDYSDTQQLQVCVPENYGCVRGTCQDVYRDMVEVPAGPFIRGDDNLPTEEGTEPVRTLTLSAFYIDRYEVSVQHYLNCVLDHTCTLPAVSQFDQRYNGEDPDRLNHPINGVSYEQARAFCQWAGKRLPTEAEWEKAARGADGRRYPWGAQDPDCTLANHYELQDNNLGAEPGCFADHSAPVDSYPAGASPYGALNMAGNVWEWTADWYDVNYYANSPLEDPTGPTQGTLRVIRGGGWDTGFDGLRTTFRNHWPASTQDYELGFRCARSKP